MGAPAGSTCGHGVRERLKPLQLIVCQRVRDRGTCSAGGFARRERELQNIDLAAMQKLTHRVSHCVPQCAYMGREASASACMPGAADAPQRPPEPGSERARQAGVYDAFVEAATERVGKLKLGSGLDPHTTLGPLINARAVDRVRGCARAAPCRECLLRGAWQHMEQHTACSTQHMERVCMRPADHRRLYADHGGRVRASLRRALRAHRGSVHGGCRLACSLPRRVAVSSHSDSHVCRLMRPAGACPESGRGFVWVSRGGLRGAAGA